MLPGLRYVWMKYHGYIQTINPFLLEVHIDLIHLSIEAGPVKHLTLFFYKNHTQIYI